MTKMEYNRDGLLEDTAALEEFLREVRHDLHRHPELSGQEYRTARRIREELDKVGLPWRAVAETGTLAELDTGRDGPTIMLRADIDALPIQEKSRCPFPSENPGVMHACGHDVHATALLGAARILTGRRDELRGKIVFVFQQSEEFNHGSQYFLRENVTDGVERIYGFHVSPDARLGQILLIQGTDAASCDHFLLRLTGQSSHISKPHRGADALAAAVDIAVQLRGIMSEFVDPMENALIGIGRLEAGNTWNILAGSAELEGTVRALSEDARELVIRRIDAAVEHVAALHRVKAEMEWENFAPCLINDPDVYQRVRAAVLETVGSERLLVARTAPMGFGADDFAAFSQRIPGCFFHVGFAVDGDRDTSAPLHSERLLIDDTAIDIGCDILTRCALNDLRIQ